VTLAAAPPVFVIVNVVVPPPVFASCRIGLGIAVTTIDGVVITVIVTVAVELPALFVAVNVYVVGCVGDTVTEPEVG